MHRNIVNKHIRVSLREVFAFLSLRAVAKQSHSYRANSTVPETFNKSTVTETFRFPKTETFRSPKAKTLRGVPVISGRLSNLNSRGILTILFTIYFLFLTSVCNSEVFLPYRNPAVIDDIESLGVNPAGLGWDNGSEILAYMSLRDTVFGIERGIFIKLATLGMSMERTVFRKGIFSRYALALPIKLYKNSWIGVEYNWNIPQSRDFNYFGTWNLGFLTRPASFLSIGFSAKNINSPEFLNERLGKIYDIGLGIRPFSENFTFSLKVTSDEKKDKPYFTAGVKFEIADSFILEGYLRDNKSIFLNLSIGLSNSNFGVSSYENTNAFYMKLSTASRRSLISANKKEIIEITIAGSILDERPRLSLFGRSIRFTTSEIIDMIDKAKEDKKVKAIVIKLYPINAGFGKIQEIRRAIKRFQEKGKKVYVYMESSDFHTYYLASACDYIIMPLAGFVDISGIKAEVYFYKELLDKLGIEAEVTKAGKYKSAMESYTRNSMSKPAKENIDFLLDTLFSQILKDVSKDRGITAKKLKALIDKGGFSAKEAKKQKLINIVDETSLEDILKKREKAFWYIKDSKFYRRRYYNHSWQPYAYIAVINVSGVITSGRSGSDFLFGNKFVGSDTVVEAIRYASMNSDIKTIILRIDSPGGSAVASDQIYKAILEAKKKKPVIISMGDVAASGGYYIASAGDAIVADRGTITGSIGVFGAKFSFAGLYSKIGVNKEVVKRGKFADLWTEHRSMNNEEKEVFKKFIDRMYELFLSRVSNGRKLKKERVEEVAQGKVFTGEDAKKEKLVDEFGGLFKAIELAKNRAKISKYKPVKLVFFPRINFPFFHSLLFKNEENKINILDKIKGLSNILALMPFTINLQ